MQWSKTKHFSHFFKHHVYFECNKVHERSCTSLFFRIKYPRTLCTGSLLDEKCLETKQQKRFLGKKTLDLILKIRRIHQSKFSVYFLCVLVTSTIISRTEFILWGSFKAIISHTMWAHRDFHVESLSSFTQEIFQLAESNCPLKLVKDSLHASSKGFWQKICQALLLRLTVLISTAE